MYNGAGTQLSAGIYVISFYVKLAVSLSEISVDHVRPLYGPVSGGTRVTISGQLLTMSTVTAV